jgi:hypothetical protein
MNVTLWLSGPCSRPGFGTFIADPRACSVSGDGGYGDNGGGDGAFTRFRTRSQSGVALRLPPHSIALGSRKTTDLWSAPAERKRRRRFDFVS